MKILKIFGLVAGIHVFALILIFANPGCSSTSKRMPRPADTAESPISAAPASVSDSPYYTSGGASAGGTSVVTFNPDAPATAAPDVRFTPTRPGTPVAGSLVTEAVFDVTPVSTYVVKAGDSLWAIARKHDLTVAQLTAANNMNAKSSLKPGQKLLIPGKTAAPGVAASSKVETAPKIVAPSAPKAAGNATMKHVVKSGESLGVIARNYGVKAGDIAVANQISDPAKILAGTELIIPGWQATAAKKSSGAATPATSTPPPAPVQRAESSAPAVIAIEPEPTYRQPSPSAQVPLIRIDESPITPAPKD
jgi:LysM repeat protein